MAVLSQQLAEQVAGRRVRTAVFTTYSFDPGFFEQHILPVLFDKPFSQVEKVRRVQLEDALRTADDVAVYYDRTALAQEATPAQLDFRRIDVRRANGAFHPKLVFLLVENANKDDDEGEAVGRSADLSLLVGALSANLTRAGWWENVEAGHFEEVLSDDYRGSRTSFREDLLSVIGRLKRCCAADEEHSALDQVHRFLLRKANRDSIVRRTTGGKYNTRLFCGQTDLSSWLAELGIHRHSVNLEVISPYFDKGHSETLRLLVEAVAAREVRVFLPRAPDGSAAVSEDTFEWVAGMEDCGVKWATLPGGVLEPGGRKATENALPRRVHAKVYRFWRKGRTDLVLVGSVNLTQAGHSGGNAGNLEAAFLCEHEERGAAGRWWLEPLEKHPKHFVETQAEETEDSDSVPLDITFRFNWVDDTLDYRLERSASGPVEVWEPGGVRLFTIASLHTGRWIGCDEAAAGKIRELLPSTSFLELRHGKGRWRVLVREEGMSHRPSLLLSLTPEDILMYWSLLSPAQQEYFITEKLASGATLQGMAAGDSRRYATEETVFDRFAGIYHAFEQLVAHVDQSIAAGETRVASARLFGAKYDSLPVLLEKTLARQDGDGVISYITLMCAKQAVERVQEAHSEFVAANRAPAQALEGQLARLPELRARLDIQKDKDRFMAWYEEMFLCRIEQPGAEDEE